MRGIGIRFKVVLGIFFIAITLMITGVSVGYSRGFVLLRDSIGNDYVSMARILAVALDKTLDEKVLNIAIYMMRRQRIDAVESSNQKYESMEKPQLEDYFTQMDEKWKNSKSDSFFIKDYTDSAVAGRLSEIVSSDPAIAEIIISDSLGGLVAASDKISDFYQGDEEWWKQGFNEGKGDVFVGSVEYDESSEALSIPVIIPIKSKSGKIVGVSKAVLDIKYISDQLKNFKIGKTGHATLVGEKGNIIFHEALEPFSNVLITKREFQKLLNNKKQWIIAKRAKIHEKPILVAYAKIKNKYLLKSGMSWIICLNEDKEEVFEPLNKLMTQMIGLIILLLVIMIVIGYMISGRFVAPIKKLRSAVERFGKGDLKYRADIRTKDEFEELGDTFNRMAKNISETTTSIDNLNKEIDARKIAEKDLNRKIKDLEVFQKITVDRELKMVELKKRIKNLEKK